LKRKMPREAINVSEKRIPNWVLHIAALFNPQAKQAIYLMGISRFVSNDKAKNILGWKPIANNEETILAAAESVIKFKI